MAECITKLIGGRPSWVGYNSENDQFGRQTLLDSTFFVDYDKIDVVEQEEEESQQVAQIAMQTSEDEKDDTLNGQGRQKSRDIYTK